MALLYLFAFPSGSITTLMHAVLKLPGPGAGIAMITGPVLVVAMQAASGLSRKSGPALTASIAFALVDIIGSRALGLQGNASPANPGGAAGNLLFFGGMALSGCAGESMLALGGQLGHAWRCVVSGIAANTVLLVYFWTAVFPRTRGWVKLSDVPILLGACIGCAVVAGLVGHAVSVAVGKMLTSGGEV